MAEKYQINAEIVRQEEIGEDIYSMWLHCPKVAEIARPGQFVALYSTDHSRLLPRPISICEIDTFKESLHLVYRVAGAGTEEFRHLKSGRHLNLLGPLGNGFPIEEGKKALIVGGGIGIPPMLGLCQAYPGEKQICLGYRSETFLLDLFKQQGEVFVATEDGSLGTRGNVLNAIMENKLKPEVIYACGPAPMLRALKEYAISHDIMLYVSLEEKMACGIGACLACVCQSKEVDDHSKVHNKRICKEGPVFDAREVEF